MIVICMELNPCLLFKVPFPSVLPWKKSSLAFSRARIKILLQSLCSIFKHSPLQDLASLVCVPSCSPLRVDPHGHGPRVC